MSAQPQRIRSVALIYSGAGEVLLILRRKEGRHYATLPGGGIEDGETPAQACAREVLEEVSLTVQVGPEVAVMQNLGNREHYFVAEVLSGKMGLGDGPEALRQSEGNWYDPQWVELSRLEAVNLLPTEVRALVREHAR